MPTLGQTQGCILGLALGDALGAPFEGGFLERCLWRVIGTTRIGEMRWTDDTQMTLDVAKSYLACGKIDSDDLAMRFAKSYRWSRGYGPGAAKVLRRIAAGVDWREANCSVYPNGSYGNGAAMRAPIIGLIFADRPAELAEGVKASAVVTHAHPLAVEGATLIARATALVSRGMSSREILTEIADTPHAEFATRLAIARGWLESNHDTSTKEIARQLGNRISAHESCVTALYFALRYRDQPFEQMQQVIAKCGSDADTIGAMAGAIWGTANGSDKLPAHTLEKLEQRERLMSLSNAVHQKLATT